MKIEEIQKDGIDWYGNPLKVDGIVGPKTLWWQGILSLSKQRQDVLRIALGYHASGMGEDKNNSIQNDGTFVDMLLAPVGLKNMSWCIAFVSHCYRKAGVTWPVYLTGADQAIKWVGGPTRPMAHFVETPLPGDLEVFTYEVKPGDTRVSGHGRIVTGYDPVTKVTAGVDGNVTDVVRAGFRHDRPRRRFIRANSLGDTFGALTMPTGMMYLDNLGDR